MQLQVTFATLDDEDTYKSTVRPLLGKQVKLAVLPNGEVSLKEATQAEQEAQALKAKRQASMAQDDASTSGWSGEWMGRGAGMEKVSGVGKGAGGRRSRPRGRRLWRKMMHQRQGGRVS